MSTSQPILRHWHLAVAAVLCLLTACEADNKYNTYYPCSFVFHTQLYPTSALTRAVTNTGEFVIVQPQTVQGIVHLKLQPNHGTWSQTDLDLAMRTAITGERLNYSNMGAGGGLVIGRSNFFGLKAFDLQCPNCLAEHDVARYALHWTADGQLLECSHCHRTYQPDNDDGLVVSGGQKGDRMLMQYHVNYQETDGRLYVHN